MPSIRPNGVDESKTYGRPNHHLPAWKKLGLKLKYAHEDTDFVGIPESTIRGKKRKDPDQGNPLPEARAQELSEPPKNRRLLASEAHSHFTETNGTSPHPTSLRRSSTNGSRKSVSFTPDTKTEDGDSARDLIAAWEAQQPIPFQFAPEKVQKPKRPKNRPKTPTSSEDTSPALLYLIEYHMQRDKWKFQKNRETYILKHLLDLDVITPSYNAFLLTYLRGLRGKSGRDRAGVVAKEAIQLDEDESFEPEKDGAENQQRGESKEMENPELRRLYHENAVKRFKGHLEESMDLRAEEEERMDPKWKRRLQKRKRAELVLWAVGDEKQEDNGEEDSARGPKRTKMDMEKRDQAQGDDTSTSSNGIKKKPKNRTAFVEVSSSSDSDSELDSGSGSEDSGGDSASRTTTSASRKPSKSVQSSSDSDSDSTEDGSTAQPSSSNPGVTISIQSNVSDSSSSGSGSGSSDDDSDSDDSQSESSSDSSSSEESDSDND